MSLAVTPAKTLSKPGRMEQFARFRAQGHSQAQSAILSGYSANSAESTGCKLDKNPAVKARIAQLRERIDREVAKAIILSKNGVLEGISEVIDLAREEKKWSDALRGYELLGKHYKLFDRAAENVNWDGDLSKLNEEQLEVVANYFERIAFNGDKTKIEEARKRAMLEAGQQGLVVDTTAELVENKDDSEW